MIRKNALVKFKVLDFVKAWNKDLMPKFEDLEKRRFRGKAKAYNFICKHFGSGFFSCVEIYADGERKSYFEL